MTSLLHEILEGEPSPSGRRRSSRRVAEGETAVQTGKRLYLSSETVKGYRKRMIAKLGARDAPHAVAVAIRRGLLPATPQSRTPASIGGQSAIASIGALTSHAHAAVRVAEPLVEGTHALRCRAASRSPPRGCRSALPRPARPA